MLFDTQEAAMDHINKDRFAADNHTYELFKITEVEEIKLKKKATKVEQPPVVTEKYVVEDAGAKLKRGK